MDNLLKLAIEAHGRTLAPVQRGKSQRLDHGCALAPQGTAGRTQKRSSGCSTPSPTLGKRRPVCISIRACTS
jgi:hypothetical protein